MAPYIIDPNPTDAVYDLIGVCNHYGGLGGGHCKLKSYKRFFVFLRKRIVTRFFDF